MRIAFIVSTFPKLSETFILNQITGLMNLGHDVWIFSEYRNTKEEKIHQDVLRYGLSERVRYFVTPEGWIERSASGLNLLARNFHRGPADVLKSLNFVRYGKKALSLKVLHLLIPFIGTRFDVIHSHFGLNGALSIYLKLMGVPGRYLTSFHGYDINSLPAKAGPGYYNDLFAHGDLFTANTEFTRKRAVELGLNPEKIVVLPVGLNLSRFTPTRRRLGPGEPLKILTIGRLVEKKGHEYGLRAVKRLSDRGRQVEYTVAGDGPERERLEALARELGIAQRVRFIYGVNESEAIGLYARNHIFMLPSVTAKDQDREGQALVLQEAQATGMPVVSTRHNGIPEGVLDGVSGLLVPERDSVALADAIDGLLARPHSWRRMGEAGRRFVESKYDSAKLAKELEGIYRMLVEGCGAQAKGRGALALARKGTGE